MNDAFVIIEGRKNNDAERGLELVQAPRCLYAIHDWHFEVEQDDIRLQSQCQAQNFITIGRLAHHLKIGLRL